MPSVSHSEVESYLLCRRKHFYGYTMSLERKATSTGMSRGSVGHSVLETCYRYVLSGGSPAGQQARFQDGVDRAYARLKELQRDHLVDDDKHISLEEELFEWYFPNEPIVRRGWQVLAVEKEFKLEYDTDEHLYLPFVIDLIAYDLTGAMVIIDHKFLYDFYSYGTTDLQPQIPKYIAGLRALNYDVAYGAYNMLRTRPLKKSSKNNRSDRLQFLELHPSAERVVRSFDEQIWTAREIQALKKLSTEEQERQAFRTANKLVCQSCQFRDLCAMELEGQDTRHFLRQAYQKRERRQFATVSEDNEHE